jgi:hypothetical protein
VDEPVDERDDGPLDAGPFAAWLRSMQGALAGTHGSDVPCGSCTACCTSSQFVHIGPDETDSLAHIPAELLFPAPGWPPGHVLVGYDERGHCPMLVEGRCSIYAHRPVTCRTYDCRVLPAAGLTADGQPAIDRQVRRWRFSHPSEDDRARHEAVRAAARFVHDHPEVLPAPDVARRPTPRAVLAVELHELFVGGDPEPDAVAVELRRRTAAPAAPEPAPARPRKKSRRSAKGSRRMGR